MGTGSNITGAGNHRLFFVDDKHLTVQDLTFKNGEATLTSGGAVYVDGNFTATGCTFVPLV